MWYKTHLTYEYTEECLRFEGLFELTENANCPFSVTFFCLK